MFAEFRRDATHENEYTGDLMKGKGYHVAAVGRDHDAFVAAYSGWMMAAHHLQCNADLINCRRDCHDLADGFYLFSVTL